MIAKGGYIQAFLPQICADSNARCVLTNFTTINSHRASLNTSIVYNWKSEVLRNNEISKFVCFFLWHEILISPNPNPNVFFLFHCWIFRRKKKVSHAKDQYVAYVLCEYFMYHENVEMSVLILHVSLLKMEYQEPALQIF